MRTAAKREVTTSISLVGEDPDQGEVMTPTKENITKLAGEDKAKAVFIIYYKLLKI